MRTDVFNMILFIYKKYTKTFLFFGYFVTPCSCIRKRLAKEAFPQCSTSMPDEARQSRDLRTGLKYPHGFPPCIPIS